MTTERTVTTPLESINLDISGPVKIVCDSKDSVFLSAFPINASLSRNEFKRYKIGNYSNYPYDIKLFLQQSRNLSNQFETDSTLPFTPRLGSGANENQEFTERYSFLSHVWLDKNDLPDGFIVLRSSDFTYTATPNNLESIFRTSVAVRFYSFAPETELGRYLRDYQLLLEQRIFYSDTVVPNRHFWLGVDYRNGMMGKSVDVVQDLTDDDIEAGFKKLRLYPANLLTLEFLFDDTASSGPNHYFGFYVRRTLEGELSIDLATYNQILEEKINELDVDLPIERYRAVGKKIYHQSTTEIPSPTDSEFRTLQGQSREYLIQDNINSEVWGASRYIEIADSFVNLKEFLGIDEQLTRHFYVEQISEQNKSNVLVSFLNKKTLGARTGDYFSIQSAGRRVSDVEYRVYASTETNQCCNDKSVFHEIETRQFKITNYTLTDAGDDMSVSLWFPADVGFLQEEDTVTVFSNLFQETEFSIEYLRRAWNGTEIVLIDRGRRVFKNSSSTYNYLGCRVRTRAFFFTYFSVLGNGDDVAASFSSAVNRLHPRLFSSSVIENKNVLIYFTSPNSSYNSFSLGWDFSASNKSPNDIQINLENLVSTSVTGSAGEVFRRPRGSVAFAGGGEGFVLNEKDSRFLRFRPDILIRTPEGFSKVESSGWRCSDVVDIHSQVWRLESGRPYLYTSNSVAGFSRFFPKLIKNEILPTAEL